MELSQDDGPDHRTVIWLSVNWGCLVAILIQASLISGSQAILRGLGRNSGDFRALVWLHEENREGDDEMSHGPRVGVKGE